MTSSSSWSPHLKSKSHASPEHLLAAVPPPSTEKATRRVIDHHLGCLRLRVSKAGDGIADCLWRRHCSPRPWPPRR
jgi:hypothetical protein